MVAPVRERGLKLPDSAGGYNYLTVAPVRERGLKSISQYLTIQSP